MKMFLGLFLVFVFGLTGNAQNKKLHSKVPADKQNTILAVVLSDLASKDVCGKPEWAEKEVYVGSIIKRQFANNEMQLSGFVLKAADDTRTYINLDSDYIDGRAASASSDLSDFLTKGRHIKVWVYRCRRILYAYRIKEVLRSK
jgi:hypothetical protein